MARQDYALPSGLWPATAVPRPKRLSYLDDAITRLVNGDEGGTWAPASPIVFGGLGVTGSNSGTVLSGDVSTGRLSAGIELAASVVPTFQSTRTRTIVLSLADARQEAENYSVSTRQRLAFDPRFAGFSTTEISTLPYYVPLPRLRMHHGATLTTATFSWRVTGARAALPAVQPSFLIKRVALAGTVADLTAAGATLVTAANFDAYYNLGKVQTLAYTPDQDNVLSSAYSYVAVIGDESGAASFAGNVFHSVTLSLTAIANMGAE